MEEYWLLGVVVALFRYGPFILLAESNLWLTLGIFPGVN